MSNKSDQHTKVSRYPLPSSISQVVDVVETTLLKGGVVRLDLALEEGLIRVTEKVAGDVPLEDATSWDGALRNITNLEEFYAKGTPAKAIVSLMHLVSQRGYHASQWVTGVGGGNLLRDWLGLPGDVDHVLGVSLIELGSLPQETLILCGSKYPSAGPNEITFAAKTTIETRSEHVEHTETSGGRRVGTVERGAATGKLEVATTLVLPTWTFND